MKIIIETILHDQQRYSTCGDFYADDAGVIHIKVSQLSDMRRTKLVIAHELIEFLLCDDANIGLQEIDRFDTAFEEQRAVDDNSEPGDNPNAPYQRQHCIATGVERILAAEMKVDWQPYEREIEELPELPNKTGQ